MASKKKIARSPRRTKAPPKPRQPKPDPVGDRLVQKVAELAGAPAESPSVELRRIRQERAAAEAQALKLTFTDCVPSPYLNTATVADLIAFAHDSGHHAVNVLENAVESHLSELSVIQQLVCGKDDDRTAGSTEDKLYFFFEHARARLEVAMILDERIKAANQRTAVAGGAS